MHHKMQFVDLVSFLPRCSQDAGNVDFLLNIIISSVSLMHYLGKGELKLTPGPPLMVVSTFCTLFVVGSTVSIIQPSQSCGH